MRLLSVVTPCYNEEQNVEEVYEQVRDVLKEIGRYRYEHIFIDNASTDKSVDVLKGIAEKDPNVRVIVNNRNFGHIRSGYYALFKTRGDAVIHIVSDLQDPPELIREFIEQWEMGYKIVIGVKEKSRESPIFFAVRKAYYNTIEKLSEIELVKNFTGFGLYDREVIEALKEIDDPYPYFRGLICDLGYKRKEIVYTQPRRKRGFTKNNFYTLYDIGMLGITNHSKVPLRLAAMLGFGLSLLSLMAALAYFIYKLVFWDRFDVGMAPVIIGLFFFSSVQLFFIGIVGEYIGSIHTQVLKRPLVVERERVNFEPAQETDREPPSDRGDG